MEWLLEPLEFAFFRNALAASVLAGSLCAFVGAYVVLRGMSYIGDALSHAVLPGVAAAYLTGGNIFAGAFAAATMTSLGIGVVSRNRRLKEDTAIGILLSGTFAAGIAMISAMRTYTADLTRFLFGDVLAVSRADLTVMAVVAVAVCAAVTVLHRKWTIYSFDPTFAAAAGLPVGFLHYSLMLLLALAIVASMHTVGVLLIMAMLVTPPATARLFTHRLGSMMLWSALLGAAASVVGLYASYYLDIASGAAIVLTSVLLFFIVFFSASLSGSAARRVGR